MKFMLVLLCLVSTVTASLNNQANVALVIFNESRGETFLGKQAVATVIYNRTQTKSKLTSFQVVSNSDQFAGYTGGSVRCIQREIQHYLATSERRQMLECLKLSNQLHNGTFVPLDDWNHFFNPDKCTPSWYNSMTNIRIIQHHLFGEL